MQLHIEQAEKFFVELRARFEGHIACEPRHPSWIEGDANALMQRYRVARVAADPARFPAAALPGGWNGLQYYRLHGSPRIYYSEYSAITLAQIAATLSEAAPAAERWCIFDNTTLGAATGNALALQQLVT